MGRNWHTRKVQGGRVKIQGRWYVPMIEHSHPTVMQRLEGNKYPFYRYPHYHPGRGMLCLDTGDEAQVVDGYVYCKFWRPVGVYQEAKP